jgi:predicted protein tyrosine phosphatase
MIESVEFMGVREAQDLAPNYEAAMISIVDPSHDRDFRLSGWRDGRVLSLRFDDLVFDLFAPEESPYILFDEVMARRVVEFVRGLQESTEPVNLFVHCMAGVSRSAAVAYWVWRAHGVPLPRNFGIRACPNVRVFDLLMKATGESRPN